MFETWIDGTVTLITAAIALPIIRYLYWILFQPLDLRRSYADVGYSNVKGSGGISKRELVNRLRRKKRIGRMPPPFPDGWFVLVESNRLPPGGVRYVQALGKHFAVFRGENSKRAFITDAYCPHLGANLATAESKVKGDCIECPFHNWRFDGNNGQCTDIPYSTKIPAGAKIKTYHCTEVNNLIYVWHHAGNAEPTWEPFAVPELDPSFGRGLWQNRGRVEYEVTAHIAELPENGADSQHPQALHVESMFSGGILTHWINKLNWHEWGLRWAPEEEEERKHMGVFDLVHAMRLGGHSMMKFKIVGEQFGPAVTHINFNCYFGRGVLIQSILPLEPMLHKVVNVFYTEKKWVEPIAKMWLLGVANMLEKDIAVWNQKTYVDKPLLVREDVNIAKYRRWFSQFYSERSKTYAEACENNVDF